MTATVVSSSGLAQLLPTDQAGVLQRTRLLNVVPKVGLIRSLAVTPTLRGRGVGTQLVDGVIEWYRALGVSAALCIGWKTAHGCHIDGVMQTTRFVASEEIPAFWTADSEARGYSCPACGHPCACSAVVYLQRLS